MKKLFEVKNIEKTFLVDKKRVHALFDLSFDVYEKETLSIVGESGCGKSLTAKILLRLMKKEKGKVLFHSVDLDSLTAKEMMAIRQKMQIIFQDPYASLNPRMKVGDIIGEALEIHKLAKGSEKKKRVVELLEQVGLLPDHIDRYPHEFSGGQRQRMGIARALAVNPEFVICDEPISALDVSIQAQIINLLKKLQEEKGLTYLFISHDLSVVKYISDRVMVMYLGHIVEMGKSEEIYKNPLHPYTEALLSSLPLPDPTLEKRREKIVLAGEVPSLFNPPSGCPFHPRCPKATHKCQIEKPKMREVTPNHFTLCHLFNE